MQIKWDGKPERICLPLSELLAKKRRRDDQWAAEKATAAVEAKKKARTTRSAIFKKAESYVKEYRSQVLLFRLANLMATSSAVGHGGDDVAF